MLQSLLLVLSLSLDTFVASVAYGTNKIKIPFKSASIITLVSTITLGISLFLGSLFKDLLSANIASLLSFLLLLGLGIFRLFECIIKSYIDKIYNNQAPLTFKLFDFKFVLEIYADETKADYDKSKMLTPKEAFYLAIALSLDSLAVGFGSSLGYINYAEVLLLSLIIGFLSLLFGCIVGCHINKISHINLSWLSGVMLIALAFIR
ncbi:MULTISPECIES: sporulation membrane protein YtaF [Romboutsia]|uniref:Sporulation protein YtaF n=1 Tax=Romboutsia hominis TaxID=1507512 RepID=A0A2P2BRA1_9FIRM|nr:MULTISPECIES: sporulation membrane protein YtaF [Romboutsia]MCH1960240.1 sporulation membrane protein YtaF [Romboutsia hominis]MCH1969325.1 sporulation membrane protein YtaF [Romboutsia hominis]MDB8794068.1 sporulation membrane protein YtaF [Romboutsia sp. 1001216sp1]MDB8796386.1 sporulation membrane protein YtaF [Romboutsia sp. 1001216sp1]MDB8797861.1 sporulation membrane protein YtaF [Romboutsia sp. 1001216sp1]